MFDEIRTVIINFQTPDLLKIAAESFRQFYPQAKLTIVDNGSKDNSRNVITEIQNGARAVTDVIFLDKNYFHGPAMHRTMTESKEDFVFFLDSDTHTVKSGFLEEMRKEFDESADIYGVGRFLKVNKRGFPAENGITVLVPAYMMIRRKIYGDLLPFEHHGMPVMKNFLSAHDKGFKIKSYPVEQYIDHKWRGTASRFGYGLGLSAKINFVLNKIGL